MSTSDDLDIGIKLVNYEQSYNEALERARKVHSTEIDANKTLTEYIFPELKDNDDDRIRKELIAFIENHDRIGCDYDYDKWIDWLKKQADKDKLIQDLGKYKVKYTQEVLENYIDMIKNNSDDERLRKTTISFLKDFADQGYENAVECIDWLKKQDTPKPNDNDDEIIRKELIDAIQGLWNNDALPMPLSVKRKKNWIDWLERQAIPDDKGEISDGYHTFNELYYYRMLYNAAFFNTLPKELVHKSKKHHDGKECFGGGWFIVMANLPTGQISNHYELKYWDLFQIPEKKVADEWDGHTPQEAAERLHQYLIDMFLFFHH